MKLEYLMQQLFNLNRLNIIQLAYEIEYKTAIGISSVVKKSFSLR